MPRSKFAVRGADRTSMTVFIHQPLLSRAEAVASAVGLSLRRAMQLYARECGRAGKVTLGSEVQLASPGGGGATPYTISLGKDERDAFAQACEKSGVSAKQAFMRFLFATVATGGLALTMKADPEEISEAASRIEYAAVEL